MTAEQWAEKPLREQCNTVEGHSLCELCWEALATMECNYHTPGFVTCSSAPRPHSHAEKKRRVCDRCGEMTEDDILILHKDGVPCWEGDPLP